MIPCYAKTEAGLLEIRDRTLELSRPARNLLLVIDERRPGADWVQWVHGAAAGDLKALEAAGLIEPRGHVAVALAHRTIGQAVAAMSYDQLYHLVTSQARDRLGLMRGYAFVLQIERCIDRDALQQLALDFLQQVQKHQGTLQARRMLAALGAAAAPMPA